MRLQQLNRNEDGRRITLAAIVTALVGGSAIAPALLNGAAEGFAGGALGDLGLGALFLGLAFGTYRRSRAAAVAALGLFVALRLAAVVTSGPLALLNIWFWIVAAILFAGAQATGEEHRARLASPT